VQVARFNGSPKELLKLEIPRRTYAVFQHRGHVSTLTQTYFTIWNEALPELDRAVADAPTLERPNATFNPRTGEGGMALWIPLEA
jgi:AraC family transcriptional regulator